MKSRIGWYKSKKTFFGLLAVVTCVLSLSIAIVSGVSSSDFQSKSAAAITNNSLQPPIQSTDVAPVLVQLSQPKSGLAVEQAAEFFANIGTLDKFGNMRHQAQPTGLSVEDAIDVFTDRTLDKFGNIQQNLKLVPQVYFPIVPVPLTQSGNRAIASSVSGLPVLDIWYNSSYEFGQIGQSQEWVNIMGNASDPDGLSSLSYTLNGGFPETLSYGSDNRRLWNTGDFNVDLSTTSLINGFNEVIVTAEDTLSNVISATVGFTYTANTTWPSNYSIDWSQETNIHDAAQIVDGKWMLTNDGVRIDELGYDRLLAIGDVTWTDYEVETQFTIHSMVTTTNWYPGVGAIMRWNGHTDSPISGWQPKTGWLPMAALGWAAYFPPNGVPSRMQIGGYQTGVEKKNFNYTLGQAYNLKFRGETVSATESTYSMKVWEDGQSEPGSWDVVYSDTTSSVADGSLLLVAQMVDATFGDVTITEIPGNPTATPTSTPTPTATPVPNSGEPLSKLFVSSRLDGTVGGVTFRDEDVLSYDLNSGQWELFLDGSDLGIGGDINAFTILNDGSILFSLTGSATLAGAGSIDETDIVRFVPISTGDSTSGTMELYFDGSDVGLEASSEDIYALSVLSDGRLILSTNGAVSVPGLTANDEDLIDFAPTQLGDTTSGTWSLYFDGSDVELTTVDEDLWGVWTDNNTGILYLNTVGVFSVTGASGDWMDVFACTPTSLGTSTACTYGLTWDGSAMGFSGQELDAIAFGRPPSTVNLISPSGNITNPSPSFSWDADALALDYVLVIYDVGTNSILLTEQYAADAVCVSGTCTSTITTNLPSGLYKWLIQASNYAGSGPWSTAP